MLSSKGWDEQWIISSLCFTKSIVSGIYMLIIEFFFSVAGFWDPVCRALVGKWVRLPADKPEAVCPPCRADRLGRAPSLFTVRPLPNRQWEAKLQVIADKVGDYYVFRPVFAYYCHVTSVGCSQLQSNTLSQSYFIAQAHDGKVQIASKTETTVLYCNTTLSLC